MDYSFSPLSAELKCRKSMVEGQGMEQCCSLHSSWEAEREATDQKERAILPGQIPRDLSLIRHPSYQHTQLLN